MLPNSSILFFSSQRKFLPHHVSIEQRGIFSSRPLNNDHQRAEHSACGLHSTTIPMLVLRSRLLRSQPYVGRPGIDYRVRYLSQTALQFDHVKHDEGKPNGLTEEILKKGMHGSQEANMTESPELEVSPNTLKEASPPSEAISVVDQVEKRVSKPNNLPISKETEELRWHDIKHFEFPYRRTYFSRLKLLLLGVCLYLRDVLSAGIMPPTFVKTSTLAHGLERVLFKYVSSRLYPEYCSLV